MAGPKAGHDNRLQLDFKLAMSITKRYFTSLLSMRA
jgi:hypothetical protein